MTSQFEQHIRRIMSGEARGVRAAFMRGALGAIEPFYAGAMRLRNRLFDLNLRPVRRLPRPVVSIGNLTTGGTGKTPMVRWLADRLRANGHQVGILSRGYRATGSGLGDELTMLSQSLNVPDKTPVRMRADPDRFAAGASLLREHPEIDVILLDDGFQHRRLARDFDLALISAAEPFGFGHVLPRGLLREPLAGLRRADAVLITHADQVGQAELSAIEAEIRRRHPAVPIYQAVHAQAGLLAAGTLTTDPIHLALDELSRNRFFAFCGIGNPQSFDRQLSRFGQSYVGHRWFGDHHVYSPADIHSLQNDAREAGAGVLLTTAKDWVKVAPLPENAQLPIWRIEMSLQFVNDSEQNLLGQIKRVFAR